MQSLGLLGGALFLSFLYRTISKGKEAADRGTISEEVHLPLRRSNSAPAELPEDSKAEGASPGSTEGDLSGPTQIEMHIPYLT